MELLQVLISGLLIGGIYALLGAGITLILGVMKVVNFAQGELLMIAMYGCLSLNIAFGWSPYVSALIVVPALFLVGLLLQGTLIRWTMSGGHTHQIVLTLGIGIVLQSLALMGFGGGYQSISSSGSFLSGVLRIGSVSIGVSRLAALVVAALATAALLLLLNRTLVGKAIRATAMDADAARLMGIPVRRIHLITMGIGAALAGLAGVVLMPVYPVYPTIGTQLLLYGFVVVVLGGLGSVAGAFIGGLIIGVIEAFGGYWLGSDLSEVIVFGFFILVLLILPRGIMRGEVA